MKMIIFWYLQEEDDSLSIWTDGYKSYLFYRQMGYMDTFKDLCFKLVKDQNKCTIYKGLG